MRLTLVQVDMDGGDAAAVLRGFAEGFVANNRPAVEPAPAQAEACATKALPAAKRQYQARTKRPAEAVPAPAAVAERSITGFIWAALAEKPMTVSETAAHALAHGFDTDSKRCSALLTYLRSKNKIYRDDNDGRWHLAVEAGRARR